MKINLKMITVLTLTLAMTGVLPGCKKKSEVKQISKDAAKLLSEYKTVDFTIPEIETTSVIGRPDEDSVGKFTEINKSGNYSKCELSIYTSTIEGHGAVPDKIYVWTPVLGDKNGKSLKCFILDNSKKLKGYDKTYAYITGNILLGEEKDIVLFTVVKDKISAVEYFNPDKKYGNREKILNKLFK